MAIYTDGWRMPPPRSAMDYPASFGEAMGATVAGAIDEGPTSQLTGIAELELAKGVDLSKMSGVDDAATFGDGPASAPVPRPVSLPMAEAKARVKTAGLDGDLKLGDGENIAEQALDIMIDRARARRERATTLARGPDGIIPNAAFFGTSFLVGALDPLNIASAFIPVVGEARYAKLLADAGESLAQRASVRAMTGAASGVVGQAAIEPIDWFAHVQDGRDFGAVNVLHNLLFGAALGAALHSGGGAMADIVRGRQNRPLYPFAPGEPHDPNSPREAAPVADLAPAVRTIIDLPLQARQDAMRGAIASLAEGEPVRSGEMLRAAADSDRRIAEAFEPERITGAALKSRQGEVFTGVTHGDAGTNLFRAGHDLAVDEAGDGFMTSRGRFVNRDEAMGIANTADQLHDRELIQRPDARLHARDLRLDEPPARPLKEPAGDRGPAIPDLVTAPKLHGGATPDPGNIVSQGGPKPALDLAARSGAGGPAIPDLGNPARSPALQFEPQSARAPPAQHGTIGEAPTPHLPSASPPSAEAWHSLAQRNADFNAPDVLAASRAADALPDSYHPDPVPADATGAWTSRATKEAAALADQADRAFDDAVNLGFITEHERETVMDRLETFEREDKVRRELLERAAACLASGLGAVA